MVILPQIEASAKGTSYPLIYFYYTQKASTLLSSKLKSLGHSKASPCATGLKVTYLFFADDSLLFCRANQQDYNTILDNLHLYETTLGQQMNRDNLRSTNKQRQNSIVL